MAVLSLPNLMTEAEAAKVLGWTLQTMRDRRCRGRDMPPHIQMGRNIRYDAADLAAWIDAKRRHAEDRD